MDNYNTAVKAAKEFVYNTTAPIEDLLGAIDKKLRINTDNGIVVKNDLSADDLYALVIRIPVECAFIQAAINDGAIERAVKNIVTQDSITDSISFFQETKGDAKERLRRAERTNEKERIMREIELQTARSLQATIERADKVYEALKKVIDAKSREFGYDRKGM